MYLQALAVNNDNIYTALEKTGPHKRLLDVGCWEGEATLEYAKHAKAKKLYGIELIEKASKKARKRGIETYSIAADRDPWPFKNNSIDCVISDQVVEHLSNLDHFFSEAYRVLAPGGYLISSTNNISSWHNIGATILGWAPFDYTNSSSKVLGIGNPLAVHTNESNPMGASWTHKCIYNVKWFSEWESLYGFKEVASYGAGYYPLPAGVGTVLKKHCAFFTLVGQK